jgi:hypothetical protein
LVVRVATDDQFVLAATGRYPLQEVEGEVQVDAPGTVVCSSVTAVTGYGETGHALAGLVPAVVQDVHGQVASDGLSDDVCVDAEHANDLFDGVEIPVAQPQHELVEHRQLLAFLDHRVEPE